jgi:alcohol-forming fatty acyl-CoA reductase
VPAGLPPLPTSQSVPEGRAPEVMGRVVFFDLDRTLLAADSEIAVGRRLAAERAISLGTMLRILAGYLSYRAAPGREWHELKRRLLRQLLQDREVAALEAVAGEVVAHQLLRALAPAGLAALEQHREAGDRVALLSAAVDIVVEPIARALAIDTVVCTRLVREHGRFTGEVAGPMPMGPGKAAALRATCAQLGVDPARAVAYADHYSDRHLLQLVGTAVVVNPQRKLAALARARDWRIERWPAPGGRVQPMPVGR